jgi:hypothetical protein
MKSTSGKGTVMDKEKADEAAADLSWAALMMEEAGLSGLAADAREVLERLEALIDEAGQ